MQQDNRQYQLPHTILLLDSDTLIRSAIKALISTTDDFQVVAETSCANLALALAEELRPTIALIEIDLPGTSGIEFILEMKRKDLGTTVVVLSKLTSFDAISNAMIAGAKAYISKCGMPQDLFTALKVAAETNDSYLPKELTTRTSKKRSQRNKAKRKALQRLNLLSNRELEVFYLLANGLQNAEIARKLFISPRTVESHRAQIVRKIEVSSNGELIRFAIKHGLTRI